MSDPEHGSTGAEEDNDNNKKTNKQADVELLPPVSDCLEGL